MRRTATLAACLAAAALAAAQDPKPAGGTPTPAAVRTAEQLGELYQRQRAFQPALEQYDIVVLGKPDYAVGWYMRALCAFHLNRLDAAAADCDRALRVKPAWREALELRGTVHCFAARYTLALADLDAALALRRTGPVESLREQVLALADAAARLRAGLPAAGFHPADAKQGPLKLLDLDGKPVALADHLGKHAVVLVFFPEPTEISGEVAPLVMGHLAKVRERAPDLEKRGAVVVGVSRGTPAEHRIVVADKGLNFPICADGEARASHAYGMEDLLRPTVSGEPGTLLGIAVVDKLGTLRHREVCLNPARFVDFDALAKTVAGITGITPPPEPVTPDGGKK